MLHENESANELLLINAVNESHRNETKVIVGANADVLTLMMALAPEGKNIILGRCFSS